MGTDHLTTQLQLTAHSVWRQTDDDMLKVLLR